MTDLNARVVITAADKVSGPLRAIAAKFDAAHRRIAASAGIAGRAMESVGHRITLGVTGPAALAVKSSADWQTAMLGWKKAASELVDPESYERARQTIKRLATQLPLTQVELTDLASAASRAGVAFKEVPRFVELAAKAADAFDMSAESAGASLASIKDSARLSNDQLNVLIGRMDLLENSMNVRGRQLIDYTNNIGALGRQAGFTNAQIAVLGATMIAAGSDVSVATTSSKNLFKTMTGGLSLSKENLSVFKKLGIDADGFAKRVQKEPVKALGMLRDRLNRIIPQHQQLGALFSLFKDQAAPAIALLFQNWDKYQQGLKAVRDEQRAASQLDESFAVTMEGLGKKLKISRNRLLNISDVLATRWMPTLDRALAQLDGWMGHLEKQPKLLQGLADGIGALAVAGPGLIVAGTALRAIGGAIGIISRLLVASPVGMALTGLGAGVFAVTKNWSEVEPAWERMSNSAERLWGALGKLGSSAGINFDGLFKNWDVETAKEIAAVMDVISKAFDGVRRVTEAYNKGGVWGAFSQLGQENEKAGAVIVDGAKNMVSVVPDSPLDRLLKWNERAGAAILGGVASLVPSSPVTMTAPRGIAAGVSRMRSPGGPSVPVVPRMPQSTGEDPRIRDALGASVSFNERPLLRDFGDIEAVVKKPIDVTGKVGLDGRADINVRVKVDGGQVTSMSATSSGHVQANIGSLGSSMSDTGVTP